MGGEENEQMGGRKIRVFASFENSFEKRLIGNEGADLQRHLVPGFEGIDKSDAPPLATDREIIWREIIKITEAQIAPADEREREREREGGGERER